MSSSGGDGSGRGSAETSVSRGVDPVVTADGDAVPRATRSRAESDADDGDGASDGGGAVSRGARRVVVLVESATRGSARVSVFVGSAVSGSFGFGDV